MKVSRERIGNAVEPNYLEKQIAKGIVEFMSKKGKKSVEIHGDGNIVGGSNNRTYVDKRVTLIQELHGDSGGKVPRKNGSSGTDAGTTLFGAMALLLLLIMAISFATMKFSENAPFIYLTLKLLAAFALFLTASLTIVFHDHADSSWKWWQIACCFGVALSALATWQSESAFRPEATALAQQANAYGTNAWRAFLCGLSPYGQSVTSQQMITSALAMMSVTSALAIQSLASGRAIYAGLGWFWGARIAVVQRGWMCLLCLVMGLTATASQTEFISVLWAEFLQSPSTTRLINSHICKIP